MSVNVCIVINIRYCVKVLTFWNSPKLLFWIRFSVLEQYTVTTLRVVGWLEKNIRHTTIRANLEANLECAQTRKPALSLSCVFWLGHFPRSNIVSESSFLHKVIYNYYSIFLGAFCLKKWRLKKWISHCIFKM